jgi:hypothetical protein
MGRGPGLVTDDRGERSTPAVAVAVFVVCTGTQPWLAG